MLVHNAPRTIRKARTMAVDLATGAYPRFVYGGPLRGMPVFTTHGVTPDLLETQLQFLHTNGYQTLTADEWYDAVVGRRAPKAKSVMLTYDDGMGSLWSVGLPLLKRHGMKIVVFLIPGRIRSAACGPTLDDLRQGRAEPSAVLQRDASDQPFLTWEEIRAMHRTGLVDFQSHTMTHSQVFCASKVEAFLDPALARRLTRFQMPEWTPDDDGTVRFGRPLYTAAPRMSGSRRYLEDPALRRACESYVAEHGGEHFFERAGWRRELGAWYEQQRRNGAGSGRYETDEERRAALWHELHTSKTMIEHYLPGKTVRHLAYPWGVDSALAATLSAEAGYVTNFPGKVAGSYMGVKTGEPVTAARFGVDFLFQLPGRGRRPLWDTLRSKLRRNAQPARANGRNAQAVGR